MFLVAESKKPTLDTISSAVRAIVEGAGGTYTDAALTFDRKLAYKIKHNWRGTYCVQRFTLPSADERDDDDTASGAIAEMTRQLNLNKDLLRYIIVDATTLPPLADFAKQFDKSQREGKKQLKETSRKIDEKLEEALNI